MDEKYLENMSGLQVCVVGLGYVGLPLAVAFGTHFPTQGFDISKDRIGRLRDGDDQYLSHTKSEIEEASLLSFTDDPNDITSADIYIITVPTPVDKYGYPDLQPLKSATETVGRNLSKGDLVIYESTVYPGATEEVCVPILEQMSGLTYNEQFFCGYSPERINPGDKNKTLKSIKKLVAGSTKAVTDFIYNLYGTIVEAGVIPVSSMKVAEAAKVIENVQRDINIAFVNELAKIFNLLDIDTQEVLAAAGTKWNFLPFSPGLVGGHCIGVDPFYIAHKAKEVGYHPEIILAGRRINDSMGLYVAHRFIKLLTNKGKLIKGVKVLILGITFKENCPDVRNSRVVDIVSELASYGVLVSVYDPWADPEEVFREYGIRLLENILNLQEYVGVIAAVAHKQFADIDFEKSNIVYDVKGIFDKEKVSDRL